MVGASSSGTVEEDAIPRDFLCPITQDLMRDPVVAADSFTYEREAIEGGCNGRAFHPRLASESGTGSFAATALSRRRSRLSWMCSARTAGCSRATWTRMLLCACLRDMEDCLQRTEAQLASAASHQRLRGAHARQVTAAAEQGGSCGLQEPVAELGSPVPGLFASVVDALCTRKQNLQAEIAYRAQLLAQDQAECGKLGEEAEASVASSTEQEQEVEAARACLRQMLAEKEQTKKERDEVKRKCLEQASAIGVKDAVKAELRKLQAFPGAAATAAACFSDGQLGEFARLHQQCIMLEQMHKAQATAICAAEAEMNEACCRHRLLKIKAVALKDTIKSCHTELEERMKHLHSLEGEALEWEQKEEQLAALYGLNLKVLQVVEPNPGMFKSEGRLLTTAVVLLLSALSVLAGYNMLAAQRTQQQLSTRLDRLIEKMDNVSKFTKSVHPKVQMRAKKSKGERVPLRSMELSSGAAAVISTVAAFIWDHASVGVQRAGEILTL